MGGPREIHPHSRIRLPAGRLSQPGPGLGADRLAFLRLDPRDRSRDLLAQPAIKLSPLLGADRSQRDRLPVRQHPPGPGVAIPRICQPPGDLRGGLVLDLLPVRDHLQHALLPRRRVLAHLLQIRPAAACRRPAGLPGLIGRVCIGAPV